MATEKLLVIRKYGTTLKDSVVALFLSILSQWELSELFEENKTDKTITFKTGSQILFKGLDDPEKIKSIANITRVWVEEANELTWQEFNQLNLRLRGAEGLQISITFNPVDEEHWIKKHFFDNPKIAKYTTVIRTTYKDNKFIDDAYKEQLEAYKEIDENYYRVYALGEWGGIQEGRIFKLWDIIPQFPDTDKAWFGLDFGFSVDPTAIVRVHLTGDTLYIDEVCYQKGMVTSEVSNYLKSEGYAGEPVICDSAEPKSIQDLRFYGINATAAHKPAGSINAGIDFIKRHRVLVTARSRNIINENRFYQWKQDKQGNFINQPRDAFNHAIDAIRYAVSLYLYQITQDTSPFQEYNEL
jgi:phage terminase large subunit